MVTKWREEQSISMSIPSQSSDDWTYGDGIRRRRRSQTPASSPQSLRRSQSYFEMSKSQLKFKFWEKKFMKKDRRKTRQCMTPRTTLNLVILKIRTSRTSPSTSLHWSRVPPSPSSCTLPMFSADSTASQSSPPLQFSGYQSRTTIKRPRLGDWSRTP